MLLSVIIPVYNVETYLVECLESVVRQHAKDFEIICVNDGSTDGSLHICNEYANRYNFIKVYTKENGGLSSARNYGLKKASGKYVIYLDSDDMLDGVDCIEYIIRHMVEKHLDLFLYDGKSFWDDKDGRLQNAEYYKSAYMRAKSYGYFDKGYKLLKALVRAGEYYASACLYCVRKAILVSNKLEFVPGQIYEDNLYTFKLLLLSNSVEHCNKIVLKRRVHEGSIMQSRPTIKNYFSLVNIYEGMEEFLSDYQYASQLEYEITMIMDSIRSLAISVYKRLDNNEKDKLIDLPVTVKNRLKIMFTPKDREIHGFSFPYYLFPEHSRIVIYGAGKIGKIFYNQGMAEPYIDIVAIVDINAINMSNEDICVLLPIQIRNLLYDYVLIAVEDRAISMSIKKDLISLGVPKEKIVWDGDFYKSKNFNKLFYERDKFLTRNLFNEKNNIYLFMIPEHGNMGDYAIAYAEVKIIHDYFPQYYLITISWNEWNAMKRELITNIRSDAIIMISGGGYFGDLWSSGEKSREIAESFPNNKVIFLPNNLTYKNNDWSHYKNTLEDMEWLQKHTNIHIFFREQVSYQFVKQYTERCYLAPDMALFSYFPNKNRRRHNKVLLVFRDDYEKSFEYGEELKKLLMNRGIFFDKYDIHQKEYVSWNQGKEILIQIINKMQEYDLVITDRLHGMILSTISEVPCIAFDNTTKKVSRTYKWIEQYPHTHLITSWSSEEVIEQILAETSDNECRYEVPKSKLEDFVEILRSIIYKTEM